MKFSLNSLKVSIAGARLSHLVQKDRMWDHGSMIEQVRTAFIYLKKAFLRNDPSAVKKCMTPECYKRISEEIQLKGSVITDADLLSVEIISVVPARNHHPDKFKALLRLKKTEEARLNDPVSFYKTNPLTEQEWLFVRDSNWWLLDEIRR
jgi:hypothetical protein